LRFLTLLFAAAPILAARLELARDGRSSYSICVEGDPSPAMRRGGEELRRFLERISGVRLPMACASPRIVIRAAGSAEAYTLSASGADLVVEGGRERGAMYGVYALLEKLGCRWFTPDVESIPRRPTIVLDIERESGRPAFDYREVLASEAADADWAARNRLNGEWNKVGPEAGGAVRFHPFVHSFVHMVPPEKYFDQHPEYFALIDGKRRAERSQLCLTNPDVLAIAARQAVQWADEHPEATYISISQNDHTGWCECDRCRRVEREEGGAHSGPLIRFVNAVAEQLEKKHPDKLVDTLAYWYTERPPSRTKPRHNVRIRLCPIEACEAHPLGKCPYNRFFADILAHWTRIAGPLNVWHYNINYSHYLMPFPDFRQMADSIRTYHRHGVAGMFMSGAPAPARGDMSELRNYVMARLLWDPSRDLDAEVDAFLAGVYGGAAPAMRRYFDLAHRQVSPPRRHMWIYDNPRVPYLDDRFLAEAASILEEAERSAGPARDRVRRLRLGIDYVRIKRDQHFRVEGDTYQPPALESLRARFADFIQRAKELRIEQLHEGQPIEDDVKMFEIGTQPWPVAKVRSDGLLAALSPPLSARVLSLARATGPNVLRVPDSGSWRYPDVGGIWSQVHADHATRVPYEFAWPAEGARVDGAVTVGGRADNGLTVFRTVRIAGGRLETSTEVVNMGTGPIPVAIQTRADYGPGDDIDGAGLALRYRASSGRRIDGALFRKGGETSGVELLDGADRPAGSWTAFHRSKVPAVENTFSLEQVARCQLVWSVRGAPAVGLSVWSPQATLKPGERLRLDSHYAIR
jgi:hypothetical protein